MPICNAKQIFHRPSYCKICTLSLNKIVKNKKKKFICVQYFYSISIFDRYYLEKFSLNVKGLDLFEVIIINFIYKLQKSVVYPEVCVCAKQIPAGHQWHHEPRDGNGFLQVVTGRASSYQASHTLSAYPSLEDD